MVILGFFLSPIKDFLTVGGWQSFGVFFPAEEIVLPGRELYDACPSSGNMSHGIE